MRNLHVKITVVRVLYNHNLQLHIPGRKPMTENPKFLLEIYAS